MEKVKNISKEIKEANSKIVELKQILEDLNNEAFELICLNAHINKLYEDIQNKEKEIVKRKNQII